MLSLTRICRFPFLTLVTMRGEWGEFNPWQVPMGMDHAGGLGTAGRQRAACLRSRRGRARSWRPRLRQAFNGCTPSAVLLSQRLIGAKVFVK